MKSLAKGVRVGVLEEGLHEHQVIFLRQGTEVSDYRPVEIKGKRGENDGENRKDRPSTKRAPRLGAPKCNTEAGLVSIGAGIKGLRTLVYCMTDEKKSDSQDVVHEVLEGGLARQRVVQDLLEYSKRVHVVQHRLEAYSVVCLHLIQSSRLPGPFL